MAVSIKDPITYNRDFLLGFESKPAAPPSNLNEILGPLHLVKGSAFPPFQRTKKDKHDSKIEKQRTKALVAKPLAAAPKKAEAKPEVAPEKTQPPKAETKRVPFSSIPKTAKNTQATNTPAKTAPGHSALKAQLTTLNKENLVNVQPAALLAVNPAKASLLDAPKDVPKLPSLALPPLDISKLPAPDSEEHRLAQRQKQIDYGYKTIGYQKYISEVPKSARESGNANHPVTPRKGQKCSKRSWDGQVRKWRRGLHQWDSKDEEEISHWMSIITEKFGSVEPEPEQEEEPFQVNEEYSSYSTPTQQFQPSLVF